MFDLKGKVAIVTGGIGLGMARGLAGAGAKSSLLRAIRRSPGRRC